MSYIIVNGKKTPYKRLDKFSVRVYEMPLPTNIKAATLKDDNDYFVVVNESIQGEERSKIIEAEITCIASRDFGNMFIRPHEEKTEQVFDGIVL